MTVNKVVSVGIDVSAYKLNVAVVSRSSHKSDVQCLREFVVATVKDGYKRLMSELNRYAVAPRITFEATGVYSQALANLLHTNGYDFDQINPLRARQQMAELRQNKTDRIDAYKLACIGLGKSYHVSYVREGAFQELYYQNRRYHDMTNDLVATANRLHRVLMQVFPTYNRCHLSKESYTYLEILQAFPHPDLIKSLSFDDLATNLEKVTHVHHLHAWWLPLAKRLHQTAEQAVPAVSKDSSEVDYLRALAHKQAKQRAKRGALAATMVATVKTISYYPELCSISGISSLSVAQTLAEFGDISRFDNVNQMNAYIGIDLRHYESGKYIGANTISKRGDPVARQLLYRIIMVMVMTARHTKAPNHIVDYYWQKKKQSSPTKKTAIRCIHKLLRTMLTMVKHAEMYDYHKACSATS